MTNIIEFRISAFDTVIGKRSLNVTTQRHTAPTGMILRDFIRYDVS